MYYCKLTLVDDTNEKTKESIQDDKKNANDRRKKNMEKRVSQLIAPTKYRSRENMYWIAVLMVVQAKVFIHFENTNRQIRNTKEIRNQ